MVNKFLDEFGKLPAMLLEKASKGTLKVSDISDQLKKLDFCRVLGLCPVARTDCYYDCYKDASGQLLVAGNGECRCTNFFTSCGKAADCSVFSASCDGSCQCISQWPNECKCLKPKPKEHKCDSTGSLAAGGISMSDLASIATDPAGAAAKAAKAAVDATVAAANSPATIAANEAAKASGHLYTQAISGSATATPAAATAAPAAASTGSRPGRKRDMMFAEAGVQVEDETEDEAEADADADAEDGSEEEEHEHEHEADEAEGEADAEEEADVDAEDEVADF
jgi:hypothetical protein